MPSVFDVAEGILELLPENFTTTWKLQKLVYYAQAWHLVWDAEPLFNKPIHAWAHGPVCPELYKRHRGKFNVSTVRGDASTLNESQREIVEIVVDHYGLLSGQQLRDQTHVEPPWQDARRGLSPRDRGESEITHDAMVEYFGALSG
ncbi:MAG: DUF4065 domain-containing protein [Aestuariivita sp.]|nr:DUF4065 domain-containing protein [Aestuariivita sp.]MCY4202111.1 DUF4065 domain-containing protein [Aestuariivita sp.]